METTTGEELSDRQGAKFFFRFRAERENKIFERSDRRERSEEISLSEREGD